MALWLSESQAVFFFHTDILTGSHQNLLWFATIQFDTKLGILNFVAKKNPL